MKAVVKTYLNIRTGKPEVNVDNNPGFYKPGEEIEIAEVVIGDKYKGINTWYKLVNGSYVWSGGVSEIKNPITPQLSSNASVRFNYNQLLKDIPNEWKVTAGNEIKLAILDGGFNIHHADLVSNIIDTYNAVDKSKNVLPDDVGNSFHGSSIAGIIAASSKSPEGIIGIAPLVKLILVKISDNGRIKPEFVKEGLDYVLRKTDASVINLSLSIDPEDYKPFRDDFITLFQSAESKNIIIVASAGENSSLLNDRENILFPADEVQCISVGAVNDKLISKNPNPKFNNRVGFIIPNIQLLSCGPVGNNYATIGDSSMAAAVLSGTCALLKSFTTNPIARKETEEKLHEALKPFNSQISLSELSIYHA